MAALGASPHTPWSHVWLKESLATAERKARVGFTLCLLEAGCCCDKRNGWRANRRRCNRSPSGKFLASQKFSSQPSSNLTVPTGKRYLANLRPFSTGCEFGEEVCAFFIVDKMSGTPSRSAANSAANSSVFGGAGGAYGGAGTPTSQSRNPLRSDALPRAARGGSYGRPELQSSATPGGSEARGGGYSSAARPRGSSAWSPSSSRYSSRYGGGGGRGGGGGGGGGGEGSSSSYADDADMPGTPKMAAAVGEFQTHIFGTTIVVKETLMDIEYFVRNFRLHDETLAVRSPLSLSLHPPLQNLPALTAARAFPKPSPPFFFPAGSRGRSQGV